MIYRANPSQRRVVSLFVSYSARHSLYYYSAILNDKYSKYKISNIIVQYYVALCDIGVIRFRGLKHRFIAY